MSDIAIKVENLSKLYQLGEVGTGTISHDINRWWAKIRGKEDPYIKVGQNNNRTQKSANEFVWSIKDINFEVKQGEVLGVIGRNGAGKSTLLKILSKITSPTTGKIYTKGRIASLLEVGTGFHPEMTGRENIYLNGAILGMRKWEIDKKFDEIVDFAGVEAYIDTPVKRYSSGMYVRLAFAVAAFLESEILIVDEVLAVGDAEFQKKCMGKLGQASEGDGRSVLFVSHNMQSVSKLCTNAILLKDGNLIQHGRVNNIIDSYLNIENVDICKSSILKQGFEFFAPRLLTTDKKIINSNQTRDPGFVILRIRRLISKEQIFIGYEIYYNSDSEPLYKTSNIDHVTKTLIVPDGFSDQEYYMPLPLKKLHLNKGKYRIKIIVSNNEGYIISPDSDCNSLFLDFEFLPEIENSSSEFIADHRKTTLVPIFEFFAETPKYIK